MGGAIAIYEPAGCDLSSLETAFVQAVDRDWQVRRVAKITRLLEQLADPSQHQLAIIPQTAGGSRHSPARLIAKIHQAAGPIPVVVVAEAGNVLAAADAIAAGATDFLVCGERLSERIVTLLGKLRGLWEVLDRNKKLDEDNARLLESLDARSEIVGQSSRIRALLAAIARVAPVPRPLLIVGERGTGKELVARAIHRLSSQGGAALAGARRDAASAGVRPLVTVNCAAFGDALLESELFGHERGAFTGADAVRLGKFEQASGGTLFLDEIGHMSLPFQQKILRVVEYGTYTRVGGSEDLRTDARIVAATNCDLRERIREGTFLADLYDRLAFEVLEVPPLRDRRGDVPILAGHFLEQFARETPVFRGTRLSAAAMKELSRYSFPGNVRELKNIIERAAYRETDAEIGPEELGLPLDDVGTSESGGFQERILALERRLIDEALRKTGGNQAAAARLLGLSYHQFRYYHGKFSGGRP